VRRGSLSSPGQLLRSARTLLDHAVRNAERNVFLVGAAAPVFDEIWGAATRRAAWSGAAGPRLSGRSLVGAPLGERDPGAATANSLLELMDRLPVPESVSSRFVGQSVEVQLVRQLIVRGARQCDPVLILVDTGTGKEVVARLISDQNTRRLQTFTAVNCGAISLHLPQRVAGGKLPRAKVELGECASICGDSMC